MIEPAPGALAQDRAANPPLPVLDVFIGYDCDEIVAYHALCQSIA